MKDLIAYKVLTADQMHQLEQTGGFAGAPADLADGFIHLSTAAQLGATVDRHFAGATGLWVAAIDLAAFGDSVKWEKSRGGELFPHLYDVLMLSAVIASGPLTRDSDGAVDLPTAG